ncbi:winged helix DNA-binding protein [Streptomyces atratus]|uniref:winged helix DNA-binding protein n=1 Tax=Streptomyces atratus TaxID=1893 RepID=UPI0035278C3A
MHGCRLRSPRTKPRATTVASLARLGLVERHPDPEGGRKQHVTLTAPAVNAPRATGRPVTTG